MSDRTRSEPDVELLDQCRAGNREALGRLFDCLKDRVYSTALHICGDRSMAADVTQDVFIKVFARLSQFDGTSAFTTWLYRIVVNTAIDHRRASTRTLPLEDAMADSPAPLIDPYARLERRRRIEAALLGLPENLRVPVVLRHIQGLSYTEIAEALEISAGTVASRLSRAHARLARELADLAPEAS